MRMREGIEDLFIMKQTPQGCPSERECMSGKFIISGEDVVKGREARDNVQRTYRFLPDKSSIISCDRMLVMEIVLSEEESV